jgi:EpsD family peptidyl-prolyl cis-trans isomerase
MGAVLALSGCSNGGTPGAGGQVVAKVNNAEITVLQVNAALARRPNLSPEAAKAASGQILQELINEELLVEKARAAKLDRNPGVVQAIESAKRNLLANAYLQVTTANAPKPSDADIKAYFNQHPEYFAARHVYQYRSIPIQASADQVKSIQGQLSPTGDVDALLAGLNANRVPFLVNVFTKSAEQLPDAVLSAFSQLKDGQATTFPFAGGVEVVQLLGSRSEPVDEVKARPFIEKYLTEQAHNRQAEQEIQNLRAAAKIEIVGNIQPPASPATPPAETRPTPKPGDSTTGIGAGIK